MDPLEGWRPRGCGFKEKERNVQIMTSHSHNENQSHLRFPSWYCFTGTVALGLLCVMFLLKIVHTGNTNTATGESPFLLKLVLNPKTMWPNNLQGDHVT